MSHVQGVMQSPGSSRGGAEPEEDETDDPMFVIKNLDTGLEMRIDDFDRLAHIATDPDPANQEAHPSQKKVNLMKGTKAFKNWTQAQAKKATATAKKAVSHVKEVAHEVAQELNVQQALIKHKLPFDASPSGRAAAEAAPQPAEVPRQLLDLLRRSNGESSGMAHQVDKQRSNSVASSSDASMTWQGSTLHHGSMPAALAASTAAAAAAAGAHAGLTESAAGASPGPSSHAASAAASTAAAAAAAQAQQASELLSAQAAAAEGLSAPSAAAAGAATSAPQPVVPAVVRLVSHKLSSRPYEAVVLAQVLEGGSGVVWAVAVSHDGAFLATAGQDCVLRVWQLTASRSKHPRSSWVYSSSSSSAGAESAAGQQISSQGSHHTAASSSTGSNHQQQQEPRQAGAVASSSPLPSTQQQQQRFELGAGGQQQQQHEEEGTLQLQQEHLQDQQQQQEACRDLPQADPPQQQQQQGLQRQEQLQQQRQREQPQPQQQQQQPVVDFGPYFSRTPVRQFSGHTEDVLDLSWSSSGGFLLSASLDKTVRLWHLSQPHCLRTFEHSDFVTSVQFHPTDAQLFVSGSLDGKIRVWSVLDACVIASVQLHQDMVTAVAFSLSGGRVMAGTMRGRVRFYDLAEGKLEYVAQVDVRNQRGQHASGRKVTSIAAVPGQPQQFLITTNDSRLRLLDGYGQVLKYKGHRNSSTQARAALSPDGSQVVCGSDDGCLFLWLRTPGSKAGSGGSGGGAAAAAGDGAANGRSGGQQRGGGGGGGGSGGGLGGAERARSMAAAAAAQYQQLLSKNASYQAFQAHEPGLPVTAVAFVAPGGAGLPKLSVMLGQGASGAPGAMSGAAAGAAEAVTWDSRRCFVQQLLVSGGFDGGIRVHELLGGPAQGRSK